MFKKALTLSLLFLTPLFAEKTPAGIVILPFTGGSSLEAQELYQLFIQGLEGSPLFSPRTIDDPAVLSGINRLEANLGPESPLALGRSLGVRYVLLGTLHSTHARREFTLILYDVAQNRQEAPRILVYSFDESASAVQQEIRRLEKLYQTHP